MRIISALIKVAEGIHKLIWTCMVQSGAEGCRRNPQAKSNLYGAERCRRNPQAYLDLYGAEQCREVQKGAEGIRKLI